MRLMKILDIAGQREQISFLTLIYNISSDLRESNTDIDKILADSDGDFKKSDLDNATVVKLFNLIKKPQLLKYYEEQMQYNEMQLGIVIDIIIRDGNCIMTRRWFEDLYANEISNLKKHLKSFTGQLESDKKDLDDSRKRDYKIFRKCVKTAYENDEMINREKRISKEEKTILNTLAQSLNLSIEEKRLIYFGIIPLVKMDIDDIIRTLKEIGILFYKAKEHSIYIPDEIVWLLRDIKNIELPNKYFRRILRQLNDSEINRIARNHQITPQSDRNKKINQILLQGINVKNALLLDIHTKRTSKNDIKSYLQNLINKKLEIIVPKLGATAEERVSILIDYFKNLEQDENIGMSDNGFEELLSDLSKHFQTFDQLLRDEFELTQENDLNVDLLINYNLKPHVILDLLSNDELVEFCKDKGIKTRGNIRNNIRESYKDVENLYIENFELIGKRDLASLKEKDIYIKESELGIKFEEITKKILGELGFQVNEELRKNINTKRHQMDILLDLGKHEIIIVECKSVKEGDFSNYSSVSRQLKSYADLCEAHGFRVMQIILVSPDYSQDFIYECEYDSELDLSLISSSGLLKIMNAFKNSSRSKFPIKLFLKGGKLNEDRIVNSISH